MKKLLIGLLALGSISVFAKEVCSLQIDGENYFYLYCDISSTQMRLVEILVDEATRVKKNTEKLNTTEVREILTVSLIKELEEQRFILRAFGTDEIPHKYIFVRN